MPGVDFDSLLREAIGLDASSLGPSAVQRAVALRQAACRIDGIDISTRVIALGERATYGPNSFRGNDVAFRDRYFRAAGTGKWQLADEARANVKLRPGNLFSPDFLPGRALYDFIFCRNVLIYFDPPTQARAVQVLLRLLAPGGCLFVGPSETGLLPREHFVSAQLPMAFAFRFAEAGSANAPPARKRSPAAQPAPARKPRRSRVAANAPAPVGKAAKADGARNEASLVRASELANAGRLAEAFSEGERVMREAGPSAGGYCLLGTIRGAGGDAKAADALYRKALYLDPGHREALAHLALLLESGGRAEQARVLRTRLRRIEQGGDA